MLLRPGAMVASTLLHLGVAAIVGGHGSSTATGAGAAEIPVELVVVPSAAAAPAEPAPATVEAQRPTGGAPPTHVHAYPVPPDHDRHPHDPSLVHLPAPSRAAEAAPSPAPEAATAANEADHDAPLHFVLPGALVHGGGPASAPAVDGVGGANAVSAETVTEAQTSVPARLLQGGTARYTAEARDAEIETDVPLEIVVDTDGRVVEARATSHIGYGLDDAAVRSIRTYRFSPAQRNARRVRVRMLWTVQFRLR